MKRSFRIGYFVSPHGLGHASRATAVIHALHLLDPSIEFSIYGLTPSWFWKLNLPSTCKYKEYESITDVGLIQKGPFEHDLRRTNEELRNLLDFSANHFSQNLTFLSKEKTDLIIADVSALGVALGNQLKIPTVLVENFTWDWIYEEYFNQIDEFRYHADKMSVIYDKVDLRIQCNPVCKPVHNAVQVNPVYRECKDSIQQTYSKLNLPFEEKFVLLTTGGISLPVESFIGLRCPTKVVIPTKCKKLEQKNNLIFVPMDWQVHFPDLVNASLCVAGKAGYGTICECLATSTPLIATYRKEFRESSILKDFVQSYLIHEETANSELETGKWMQKIHTLKKPTGKLPLANGAKQAVKEISSFIQL